LEPLTHLPFTAVVRIHTDVLGRGGSRGDEEEEGAGVMRSALLRRTDSDEPALKTLLDRKLH
jgi:hypothetical protein